MSESSDGKLLPRISLPMLTRIAQHAPSRQTLDPRLLAAEDHVSQIAFSTTRERAIMALALNTLHALQRHGSSRVDVTLTAELLGRFWSSMSEQERVEVEIETYDMLEFVGSALDPSLARSSIPPTVVTPDSSHEDVARWAITHAKDLRLEFYDRHAGALVSHHITPMSLDAGVYLRAISHTTREERVFSIKRVGVLEPIQGWTMRREVVQRDDLRSLAHDASARKQMSWLDEVPAPQEEE